MEPGLPDYKGSCKVLTTQMFFEVIGTAVWVIAFNYGEKDYFIRAISYFATYMICSNISGAHCNPAVTLGVYIASKEYKRNFLWMLLAWFCQCCGAFIGIVAAHAIMFHSTPLLYPAETMYKGKNG